MGALGNVCSVLYVDMCIYALGLFWGLVSQIEQVCTQNSRLFSFLRKKREDGIELSSLQHMTCSSVCASPMVVLLGPCLILN